jgi:hypothetical protein
MSDHQATRRRVCCRNGDHRFESHELAGCLREEYLEDLEITIATYHHGTGQQLLREVCQTMAEEVALEEYF